MTKTITISSTYNNATVNIRVNAVALDDHTAQVSNRTHYAVITPSQYKRIMRAVEFPTDVSPVAVDRCGKITSAEVYFNLDR